jgi:hypothetical protein
MNLAVTNDARIDWHKVQQAVKWIVYTLLIVNWVFYFFEDWNRAMHTLTAESGFLDWTEEFATSIDESAWFLLLFMFEIETYVVDDKDWKGWITHTVRGVRIACYVMLAHSVYAFTIIVMNLQPTIPVEGISDLCELNGSGVSYVFNLEYTEVDADTCTNLSDGTQLYHIADDPLVTTLAGLELERDLAWADLAEVIIWLLVLLVIEIVVRMQSHGISGGPLIKGGNAIKLLLYASLMGLGIYWASLTHWLYLWDEFLWIAGFAAIEMNLSEWRDEMQEETAQN